MKKLLEFFKPNKLQLIIFLILIIPLLFVLIGSTLAELVYPLLIMPLLLSSPFEKTICGGFDCAYISTPLSDIVFSLIYMIEVYLILCLLFYVYRNIIKKWQKKNM